MANCKANSLALAQEFRAWCVCASDRESERAKERRAVGEKDFDPLISGADEKHLEGDDPENSDVHL